jgi:hypothetical protein
LKYSLLLISLLLFISCAENNIHEEEDFISLEGNWEGYEIYHKDQDDSLRFKGYFMHDLVINPDTIYRMSYPTRLISKFTYKIEGDSITFIEKNNMQKFRFELSDSLLILENFEYDTIFERKTYRKQNFDNKAVNELYKNQINLSLLQSLSWRFDYNSTKSYGWRDIDTNLFAPPIKTNFHVNNSLYLDSLIFTKSDTFKYMRFRQLGFMYDNKYLLHLEKEVNNQIVILSYTASLPNSN